MGRAPVLTALSLLGVLGLAGCTEPGTPKAVDTSTPDTGTSPTGGAVRVDDPIDATAFYADPCKLLSADQVAPFDVGPVGQADLSMKSSPACTWEPTDRRGDFSVSFTLNLPNGLSDQYAAQEQLHKFDLWEPTEVSGYPAVFNDIRDDRESGTCGVMVGINDEVTFNVSRQHGAGPEVCDQVVDMAEQVLITMKGA